MKLPKGAWSRAWRCCRECGTTEREHYGKGLCARCYRRAWSKTPKGVANKRRGNASEAAKARRRRWNQMHRDRLAAAQRRLRAKSQKFPVGKLMVLKLPSSGVELPVRIVGKQVPVKFAGSARKIDVISATGEKVRVRTEWLKEAA